MPVHGRCFRQPDVHVQAAVRPGACLGAAAARLGHRCHDGQTEPGTWPVAGPAWRDGGTARTALSPGPERCARRRWRRSARRSPRRRHRKYRDKRGHISPPPGHPWDSCSFPIAERRARSFPVPESGFTVMAMTSGAAAASADVDSLYRDLRAVHLYPLWQLERDFAPPTIRSLARFPGCGGRRRCTRSASGRLRRCRWTGAASAGCSASATLALAARRSRPRALWGRCSDARGPGTDARPRRALDDGVRRVPQGPLQHRRAARRYHSSPGPAGQRDPPRRPSSSPSWARAARTSSLTPRGS